MKLDWVRNEWVTITTYRRRHRTATEYSVPEQKSTADYQQNHLYDALKIDLTTYCFVIFISVGIFCIAFSLITFPKTCDQMICTLCVGHCSSIYSINSSTCKHAKRRARAFPQNLGRRKRAHFIENFLTKNSLQHRSESSWMRVTSRNMRHGIEEKIECERARAPQLWNASTFRIERNKTEAHRTSKKENAK